MSGPIRVGAALLAGSVMCGGCGLILGLDEFTDAPVGTGGGGAGQGGDGLGGGGGLGGSGGGGGDGGAGQGGGGLGGGEAVWSRIYGDANLQEPTGVAIDTAGNVFVTGVFEGAVPFGDHTLISAGGTDIFLVKLAPDGNPLWSKQFGDAADEQVPLGIAVDGDGNVVITGRFKGSVKFGTTTLSNAGGVNSDVFVAKFDAGGTHVWSKRFGGTGSESGTGIAVDPGTGDVVVTGWFVDTTINFGTGPLTTAGAGDSDVFVAKLGATTGNGLWSHDYGGTSWQQGTALAVDPVGNIVMAGSFGGSIIFGAETLTDGQNPRDMFLVRLDSSGNPGWAKQFADVGDHLEDLAVDASGSIIAAGWHLGATDFGCGPLSSALSRPFAAKLDAVGTCTWSRSFDGAGSAEGIAAITDPSGNVILAGSFSQTIDFGGGSVASEGSKDIFMAKLDGSGAHLWSRRAGGAASDVITAIAVDASSGEIALAGFTHGSLDFGTGPLTSAGYSDIVVARLAP